jgi:hypothetical protein
MCDFSSDDAVRPTLKGFPFRRGSFIASHTYKAKGVLLGLSVVPYRCNLHYDVNWRNTAVVLLRKEAIQSQSDYVVH